MITFLTCSDIRWRCHTERLEPSYIGKPKLVARKSDGRNTVQCVRSVCIDIYCARHRVEQEDDTVVMDEGWAILVGSQGGSRGRGQKQAMRLGSTVSR
jgi:hypothetical protein